MIRTAGLARSLLIYYGQPWKRRRMDALYGRFVRPGDLCFDLGSHVGNRVACFRRLGARVVAVEPQPDCVAALRWLYGRDAAVAIEAVGVGHTEGVAELAIATANPTVSTFSAEWREQVGAELGARWDQRLTVAVTTLDALIAKHGEPRFCKVDVEGFELEVLEGLGRPLAALSFEFLPGAVDRALACVDRLEALGTYRYGVSLAERHSLLWEPLRDVRAIRAFLAAPGDRSGDVYAERIG